jgi:hypothetical protein
MRQIKFRVKSHIFDATTVDTIALRITTVSTMPLSMSTFRIMTQKHHTQHEGTKLNYISIQTLIIVFFRKMIIRIMPLSITTLSCKTLST